MAANVPGRGSDPRHRRALPRLHLDADRESRARPDREPRDARLHRRRRRLLPRRHAHARLAHLRGPGGVVSQLRLPAARRHRLPAGAEGRARTHRRSPRARLVPAARPASSATSTAVAGSVTARRSSRRPGCSTTRSALTARSTARARRSRSGWTSTRSTTRSSGAASGVDRDALGRRALRRLQPHERRLPPEPPRDGRRAPRRHAAAAPPGSRAQGLNSVLHTTHRQNFLVPPRRHRSFPLAELE